METIGETVYYDDYGNPVIFYNESCSSFKEEDDDELSLLSDDDFDIDSEFSDGLEGEDEDFEDDGFEAFDEEGIAETAMAEYLHEHISNLPESEFNEIVNSVDYDAFEEAGKLPQRSLLVLSRDSELKKRQALIAVEIERRKNSALYKNYKKYRQLYLNAKKQIMKKNGARATAIAKKQVRIYLKNMDPKTNKIARTVDNLAKR